MAASLKNVLVSLNLFKCEKFFAVAHRGYQKKKKDRFKSLRIDKYLTDLKVVDPSVEPKVCLSADKQTVICWHPEPDFPYEHTTPLPLPDGEPYADSTLKVQYLKADALRYREEGPTDAELANLFFTTKHEWFPHRGRKYRKPFPPKDRRHI